RISMIARGLQDRGESPVPAIQPLAFSTVSSKGEKVDYIVVRTPEHVRGIALKTGKLAWVHPWNDTPQSSAQKLSQGAQQQAAALESQMRQRLWDDNLYAQMSSDGQQLFFVDDLEYMNPSSANVRA